MLIKYLALILPILITLTTWSLQQNEYKMLVKNLLYCKFIAQWIDLYITSYALTSTVIHLFTKIYSVKFYLLTYPLGDRMIFDDTP